MTEEKILEIIKSGKKLSETFLNYLVNSSYVVGEKIITQDELYTDLVTIIKIGSKYIEIKWMKSENEEENEFLYQPYLVKAPQQ